MLDRSLNPAPSPLFGRIDDAAVEWRVSPGLTPYPEAVAFMEQRAAQIAAGERQTLNVDGGKAMH